MDYKKMALLNTIGNIVYLFALWVLTVIITRVLGFGQAGIFSLAMSVGNIFFTVQMYGMRSYQVSDVAGEHTPYQYFNSRYVTSVVGLLLCVGYCTVSGYTWDKVAVILLYTLFRTFEAVSDAYFGELQKIGRLDILAKSLIAKSILMIILFVGIMVLTKSLVFSMLSIVLLSAAVTVCYDRVHCRRLLGSAIKKTAFHGVMGPVRSCFLLMVATLIPIVITSLPRIMLDVYNGEEILGYYGNISAPTMLLTAIVPNILFPVMTWYGQLIQDKNWDKLVKGAVISIALCVVLGIAACLTVWLLGDFVMALVFTDAILPYVPYMYPLIIATVIYAMTMCCNSVLISLRKNKQVTLYTVLSLIAACFCVVPLVKNYSIIGAILVLGIAYTVQLCLQIVGIVAFFHKKSRKE